MTDASRPRRVFSIGSHEVEFWPDSTRVILGTGEEITAAPQTSDEYRANAEALGYGSDTDRMCREHDLLHAVLCEALGLPYSPTLKNVAGGQGPTDLTNYEEDMVLAAQRFLNAAGVDIVEVLERRREPDISNR